MGQLTNDKILLAIRITVWIQELISGFVTFMRYGKWLTDINLLLILIRQMAAQVRRALAEVMSWRTGHLVLKTRQSRGNKTVQGGKDW